jgi:hypothetical protein
MQLIHHVAERLIEAWVGVKQLQDPGREETEFPLESRLDY